MSRADFPFPIEEVRAADRFLVEVANGGERWFELVDVYWDDVEWVIEGFDPISSRRRHPWVNVHIEVSPYEILALDGNGGTER